MLPTADGHDHARAETAGLFLGLLSSHRKRAQFCIANFHRISAPIDPLQSSILVCRSYALIIYWITYYGSATFRRDLSPMPTVFLVIICATLKYRFLINRDNTINRILFHRDYAITIHFHILMILLQIIKKIN